MYKITKTYEDYNGVSRTEDFYFNLTESEVMEMEMSTTGGLVETIKAVVAAQDAPAIVKIFKKLVLDSYGEKSLDGRRFVKSDELSTAFSQTDAYNQIFMELATDADAAAKFVNGIIPTKKLENASEATNNDRQITASNLKQEIHPGTKIISFD